MLPWTVRERVVPDEDFALRRLCVLIIVVFSSTNNDRYHC